MPKPILVIHMGTVNPERLTAYADFMYTSQHTKFLRDEYHLVIRDQTAEEKCYIISTDQPPYDIDPVPHTINKLKKALDKRLDLEEKQEFFGYKIRRSTMQDLESLMLTAGHASFKASDDGEIFITV